MTSSRSSNRTARNLSAPPFEVPGRMALPSAALGVSVGVARPCDRSESATSKEIVERVRSLLPRRPTHLGLGKGTPGGRVTASVSAHGNKIISFPRLGGLHHRYTVAAQDFKVRDSALTKTIYLESAKDALSVRPEPANLLTRSLPDSNSGVFFEQSRQHATRKHSVLEFWRGTAPLSSTGHNTSIHW